MLSGRSRRGGRLLIPSTLTFLLSTLTQGYAADSRLVLPDLVGETVGLLQDLLDRWPSQKARTPGLILDALCQPPDDGRGLPKGRARLHRIAGCLIHPAQGRLDLPLFSWQPNVCGQPCCLA